MNAEELAELKAAATLAHTHEAGRGPWRIGWDAEREAVRLAGPASLLAHVYDHGWPVASSRDLGEMLRRLHPAAVLDLVALASVSDKALATARAECEEGSKARRERDAALSKLQAIREALMRHDAAFSHAPPGPEGDALVNGSLRNFMNGVRVEIAR